MQISNRGCGRAPSALFVLFGATGLLSLATSAAAVDKHWNLGGTANWNTGGNWSPVGVPGALDAVFIGDTVAAADGWVNLNVDASIASLTITDGMTLETDLSHMGISGLLTCTGYNTDGKFGYPSRIIVRQGVAIFDCTVEDVFVDDGGRVDVAGGSSLRVDDYLNIGLDGVVSGEGYVFLYGNNALAMKVNGGLGAGIDGLVINQLGDGLIDLDGDAGGDHVISVSVYNEGEDNGSDLTINGTALADQFDDDMTIGAHNMVDMSLSDGWAMGAGSLLRFIGDSSDPNPAQLNGGALELHADIEFSASQAHGQFNCPLSLMPAVNADLGPTDRMECNGTTTVEGGVYTLGEDARIDFDGSTTVHGGTFTTVSDDPADGAVNFNGQTTWNGSITVNGIARQFGSASVTGPTVITADVFDMDGFSAVGHEWNIANSLTINADKLDTLGVSNVESDINIEGTFLGKLTVNLTNPFGWWAVSRTLNVGGVAAIMTTRISGSQMVIYADMNVDNRVAVTADMYVSSSGTVNFADADTQLRTSGTTEVQQYSDFIGHGELQNAPGGVLILDDGADLDNVGVLNEGELRVGNSPGVAFVDRLNMAPTSLWSVELGGYTPGSQHDLLFVTQDATHVDGILDVNVINLGGGTFDPQQGDEFIILRATGALDGTFDKDPISYGNGKVYLWSVAVGNDTVTLHLDDTLPCPADLNSDGIVDGADLGILLGDWGACPGCISDLVDDNLVDGADLGVLLGEWGPCL